MESLEAVLAALVAALALLYATVWGVTAWRATREHSYAARLASAYAEVVRHVRPGDVVSGHALREVVRALHEGREPNVADLLDQDYLWLPRPPAKAA